MAALSAFALSVLSVEQAMERGPWQSHGPTAIDAVLDGTTPTVQRPARATRRATSHYNTFQTHCLPDNNPPPTYATATRQKEVIPRPHEGREPLPNYTCTVSAEAKVLLNLELINPLHSLSESEWREVYIIVQGTMLSIHRVKDGACGKHLRSYTLQHAEVGLAADTAYTVLSPNTRLAQFIPGPARQKAFKKDPRLFKGVKQHILRIRLETDQLLFAQPSEEATHNLINAISAGIDIAQPIDERSASRQCTVPRRRRRIRPQHEDVNDPALIAEQARLLREMYPSLSTPDARSVPRAEEEVNANTSPPSPREEEEIDVSELREETPRPVFVRSSTQTSMESRSSGDMLVSDCGNFNTDGKWQPPHIRTEAQILRYTRRCMPILLADAARASDVLIYNGRRVKISWRHESLDEWELKPPSYRSHGFSVQRPALERSTTEQRLSQADSDIITPLEDGFTNLELTKAVSGDLTKAVSGAVSIDKSPAARPKGRRAEVYNTNLTTMQGVVYCF